MMLEVSGLDGLVRAGPDPVRRGARRRPGRGRGAGGPQRRREDHDLPGHRGPRGPARRPHLFDGQDVSRLETFEIVRRGLAFVPEDRRIFTDLTVEENLAVGLQKPRDGAPLWTPERLYELFPNLGAMRNRPGGRMSGGEQQMLTIARSLMGNPRLVLLDEPSEGLAPKIVEEMAHAILAMKREGLSMLVSEQNLHFARLIADRAVVIERGHVRFSGAISELDRECGVT